MKLKTLIGTLGIACTVTGFSATNVELTQMLKDNNYAEFTAKSSYAQFTNLVTSAAVSEVAKVCATTNTWDFETKANLLDTAKKIEISELIDIFVAHTNRHALYLASRVSEEKIAEVWSKLINNPKSDCRYITDFFTQNLEYRIDCKLNNVSLARMTAERCLAECPELYTLFVYNTYKKPISFEYKTFMDECAKNVKTETCNLGAWIEFVRRGYGKTMEYYFEDMWKIKKTALIPQMSMLFTCNIEYRDQAIETWASTVEDPHTAYHLVALPVDRYRNNNNMTVRLFSVIAKDVKYGIEAAIYLKDNDKLIDVLLTANEKLSADDLNKIIPAVNILDIDFRKDDVVKVLRNLNSRYTIRLYEDYKTWEPIISKLRAMIEVRNM